VQFQDTDLLQHMVFDCVSPRTRDRYPQQRDRLFRMFKKLDDCISEILKMACDENCSVTVVSDHGLCKMRGVIHPNALLFNLGYIKPLPLIDLAKRRLVLAMQKLGILKNVKLTLEQKMRIDWKSSRAMVLYPALSGYVYLNVKGRNKDGCVEPAAEYARLVSELRTIFSKMRDPLMNEPLFEFVGTPAELYSVDNPDPELVGDLVLVPKGGYIVRQTFSRRAKPVEMLNKDSIEGNHCHNGIYIFNGPGIRKSNGSQAHIVDVAPTLMTMLGAEVGSYMDGKVVENAFSARPNVRYRSSHEQSPGMRREKHFSQENESEMTRRWADLGYF